MAIVSLQNAKLKLDVSPQAGASIASLALRLAGEWLPILRPTPADAIADGNTSLFASFPLVPWSNRIRDARFRFAGRDVALRPNTPEGYAIHGDVRKRPWTLAAQSDTRLSFAFDSRRFDDVNFPFPFTCELAYAIEGTTLAMSLALRNEGDGPMPAGMGFHPYYRRTLIEPDDDVELRMSVGGVYRGLLPTGPAVPIGPAEDFRRMRPIGASRFDHCFAGWDGRAVIRWPKSGVEVGVEASEPFRHLVLFVPRGKDFFAVEPVSHANDGFNLLAAGVPDSGVRVLQPGETLSGDVRVRVVA
jgi:aldose 1-epimerase